MAERNPAVEFRQDTGYIDDMARRAARQLGDRPSVEIAITCVPPEGSAPALML